MPERVRATHLRSDTSVRVVVTGMGVITPVGLSVSETWQNALAGKSGIARIERFDASDYPVQIAGEVKDFEPERYVPRKEVRRMARCSMFAVAAAQEAIADAGLPMPLPDPERAGTVIGVGMGGLDWALEHTAKLWHQGVVGVNPFALAASLPNMPSHHVSLLAGAQGPITTPVAACATGSQSIGEATPPLVFL